MTSPLTDQREDSSADEPSGSPSRRALLGGTGVVLVAAATGFVVAGRLTKDGTYSASGSTSAPTSASAPAEPSAPASPGQPPELTSLDKLTPGGGVILSEQKVVLTRDADGGVHGFSAVCTHQGCLVAQVGNGTIDCPCHGSKFDLKTGAPVAGPARRPLPAVAVEVVGNSVVAR
jgi:Rieske Fe-S protein